MLTFQKFAVQPTDRFQAINFPTLDNSLQQVAAQLAREPYGPKAEMLLSFVKNHSISSQLVSDHPKLAQMISTKSMPLQVMEDLFESSKTNQSFRKDLEEYIAAYLKAAHIN